ncbi:Adenosine deaminase AGSA like protein [Verticillium longisporum]|uniref:adenosine deaminase n=1 Tax=Verticillium longisporum TaxID=100787 RepID=A0A8I2ZSV6_VERLO|nr:Adenosine deaminase AGSA like protein [Verticillium longisporum]KAG7138192.1 Adenosine deaminase AGSA like protein [Verticillium longisporum]
MLKRRLMGIFCSNPDKEDNLPLGDCGNENHHRRNPSRLVKKPSTSSHQYYPRASMSIDGRDMEAAAIMVDAQEAVISKRLYSAEYKGSAFQTKTVLDRRTRSGRTSTSFADVEDYEAQRKQLQTREKALAYDFRLESQAKEGGKEMTVNRIIQVLKVKDRELFEKKPPRHGYGEQEHARFPGDHFLSNVDIINKTHLLKVAQWMPKGAHLHIHFNSCLLPGVLLNIAKTMDRMFIRSSVPLVRANDPHAFERCEIQFSIRGKDMNTPGDIFSSDYEPTQEMHFKEFLNIFPRHAGFDPMPWLEEKLMFTDEEAHNKCQTVLGAWSKFNGRTRMMKGLFNYETAYRKYTRLLLEDFVRDNIQYAEIRPNFMTTNQVWLDDGSKQVENQEIVKMIIDEYEKFQRKNKGYFGGMKIIYCTPRSFTNDQVRKALGECLEFKGRWPEWIAGFDLVGEEGQGRPLREFVPEFLEFRTRCDAAGYTIPFLFHCGETLEMGNDTDGNLLDALLLNSRRIGHGFALARHPYVMEQMKLRGVCLEVCPISNEVLGLTPRMNGHSIYNLLANDVHCTISSDNGTLFRSTLSHDFYQFMVGRQDTTLFGWKQLIQWSIKHACMEDKQRNKVTAVWEGLWETFLDKVIEQYSDLIGDDL